MEASCKQTWKQIIRVIRIALGNLITTISKIIKALPPEIILISNGQTVDFNNPSEGKHTFLTVSLPIIQIQVFHRFQILAQ
jgi:hypothetical protein